MTTMTCPCRRHGGFHSHLPLALLALLLQALLPCGLGATERPGSEAKPKKSESLAADHEAPPGLVEAQGWQNIERISNDSPDGVPCLVEPNSKGKVDRRLHYKEPLVRVEQRSGFARVLSRYNGDCWVEEKWLSKLHSSTVYCLKNPILQPLLPLEALLSEPDVEVHRGRKVGLFFPTFYQIALEQYHPLKKGEEPVKLLDQKGRPLASVSPSFKKALLMQGTAALEDGTVLNVGKVIKGERRYVALPKGHMGLGVSGYNIYPYRSVALDFDWLCDQLDGQDCTKGNVGGDKAISKKNRKSLVGTLLFIERLAGARIGNEIHDGFVCAVDVGGGIKNDRMDIFVGTDGAGNPYYPSCRRDNPFMLNGVESLIPSDWHYWEQLDGKGDRKRVRPTEYRQNAPHKGLQVIAFPGVRCSKSAETPKK